MYTYMNKRIVFSLSASFVLISLIFSCKKTENNIGGNLLNPDDLLASGAVDTFQLETFTIREDTLRTDNQINAVLGVCHDPKMGTMNANFYTEFGLGGAVTFNSADIAVVDSVVLSLNYAGSFGKLQTMDFRIERLTEEISENGNYKKGSTLTTDGLNLIQGASVSQKPDLFKEVVLANGDTLDPQLRLKLSDALGQQFLNDAIANNAAFDDDLSFQTYFKGLKVSVTSPTPSAGQGGIIYLNLQNAETKIAVYYKLMGSSIQRTLDFGIENDCMDFNHADIDNSAYPVEAIYTNPILGQTQFFAQAFQSRAVVRMPTIKDLTKNTIIQSAVLELPIAYQSASTYYPSIAMSMGSRNTTTGEIIGFDSQTYNVSTKSYVYDVKNFLQQYIIGNHSEEELYFYTRFFFSCSADRVIFNGPLTSNKAKPRLIIKYTEF